MPSNTSPKGKKRKKSGGESPSPHKKPSVKLQTVSLKVEKPSASVDPILVSFPGGVPSQPPEFEWRKLHAKSIAGRHLEGKDPDGTCVYRATSQGMGYDDRRTKVCIGIYDKQKGVVTVHQVASRGTVYALQQHLTTYQETVEEEITAMTSMELFADFGSSKKRKALKSQQANRVNVDTVIGSGKTMIDSIHGSTTSTTTMSESNRTAIASALERAEKGDPISNQDSVLATVEAAHEQARRSFLPPYNRKAKTPGGIYDFSEILGDDGWTHVCRTVDACIVKEDFVEAVTRGRPGPDGSVPPPEKRDWAPSVLECLQHVTNKGVVDNALSEDEEDAKSRGTAKHQLRCILVLHYLIRFYKRFQGGNSKRRGRVVPGLDDNQPKWFGIPRGAAAALLRNFGTEHDVLRSVVADDRIRSDANPNVPRFILSPANKDRCLVHILLVYLLARGGPKFMTVDDMKLILDDLDLEVKQAGNLLRMAGCTVSTNLNTRKTTAFLEVPLEFPKPKRRVGK